MNRHAKEEFASVELKISLEESLQHTGVFYSAERELQERLEKSKSFRAVVKSWSTSCYYDYPQFVANLIIHDTKLHPRP